MPKKIKNTYMATRLLKKVHSFTVIDILKALGLFILSYGVFWVTLFFSTLLSIPNQIIAPIHIILISVGALLLYIFTYFRQRLVSRKKEITFIDQKIIYDCFGGALEQLLENNTGSRSNNFGKILVYIEKVLYLILKIDGNTILSNDLCANLMIKKINPNRLSLEYFGTMLAGRKKIDLLIDDIHPYPGAPEAYQTKKVAYINDTKSKRYKNYFDESKTYRSILSIPICNINQEIFAVLNIDSSTENQFISTDYISKRILPVISPFITMIQIIKQVLRGN